MKTSCFLVLLVCSIFNAEGQTAIGGKIGLNLATYIGDTEESFMNKGSVIGFQIGGIIELGITDRFSIQPELVYIRKGVSDEFTLDFFGETTETELDLKLNYIELPILGKLRFGTPESTNFFVTAGPSFGYATGGETEQEITVGGETTESSEDIEFSDNDGFRRFELGAALGIGLNIPSGSGNFFGEVRYSIGITSLNDDDISDLSFRNSAVGLSVGYLHPLGN
jgi:hypothetical protein